MFGIEKWVVLAVILSFGAALVPFVWLRTRGWVYRLLMVLGFLALIWGVLPAFGGGGISPYLVVGAIIAFGFIVLSDAAADDTSW